MRNEKLEIKIDRSKYGEKQNPIKWGCSSAGRAPALQAGGHGFESHHLHQVTFFGKKGNQRNFIKRVSKEMFIENRIRNKRNETDSCILRKTCYKDISKH